MNVGNGTKFFVQRASFGRGVEIRMFMEHVNGRLVQEGDCYDGGGRTDPGGTPGLECHNCMGEWLPRWWAVGSKYTSVLVIGQPVPRDVFCYTPKGKINRSARLEITA